MGGGLILYTVIYMVVTKAAPPDGVCLRRDLLYAETWFWGREFWDYMFLYARHAPGPVLAHFKTLLFFIPCEPCRVHFRAKLRKAPPPQGDAFSWLWRYKNEVNARIGKELLPRGKAVAEQAALDEGSVLSTFLRTLSKTLPRKEPPRITKPGRRTYREAHVRAKCSLLMRQMRRVPRLAALLATRRLRR